MIKFTVGGRSVSGGNFGRELSKEIMKEAFDGLSAELRDRFGSIRHPETGEFAFVTIHGKAIEDMRLHIEGSAALLEVVKTRIPQDSECAMNFDAIDKKTPRVFLSYGTDDAFLAEKIARALTAQGIHTWWAEWEIESGDSFRRKIDAGLSDCTHFMVLLTPNSIMRPWVNEEIDAGFVRKVNATSRFIPIRHLLPVSALPPLLSGMLCREIDTDLAQLKDIVSDIYGLTRKPALGPVPAAASAPYTGYSAAATLIAEIYVRETETAESHTADFEVHEISERTGLSQDDVVDALYELRAYFTEHHGSYAAQPKLYAEFDQHWQPWNPATDALKLAVDIVSDPDFPYQPREIAQRYDWTPRRLNPAIFYLKDRGAIDTRDYMGTTPFITGGCSGTDATRRFVKSRS